MSVAVVAVVVERKTHAIRIMSIRLTAGADFFLGDSTTFWSRPPEAEKEKKESTAAVKTKVKHERTQHEACNKQEQHRLQASQEASHLKRVLDGGFLGYCRLWRHAVVRRLRLLG